MIHFYDMPQGSEAWDDIRRKRLTSSEFDKVCTFNKTSTASLIKDVSEEELKKMSRAKRQLEVYEVLKNGDTDCSVLNDSGLSGLVKKGLAQVSKDDKGCNLTLSSAKKHVDLLIARSMFTPAEIGERPPTEAMDRGTSLEDSARMEFEFTTGMNVEQVGFCINDEISQMAGSSTDGMINDRSSVLEVKCPLPQTHLRYLRQGFLPTEYRAQVHGAMAITGVNSAYFMSYCPKLPNFILKVQRDNYTSNLIKVIKAFDSLYQEQLADLKTLELGKGVV